MALTGHTMTCDMKGCQNLLTVAGAFTAEQRLDEFGRYFHITRFRCLHICRECLEKIIAKELAGEREKWNIEGVN